MSQRGPFIFLVVMLIAIGLVAATVRHQTYDIPWLPGTEAEIWQVEARVQFTAKDGPSQVLLTLPPQQSGYEVIGESAASSGWGFSIDAAHTQRRAHWSQRQATGEQTMFYKLDLATNDKAHAEAAPAPAPSIAWDEPYATAVNDLLAAVVPISADPLTLASQLIQVFNTTPVNPNLNLLLGTYSRVELLTRIIQTTGTQARGIQVLELEDGRRRQDLTDYIQVWHEDAWHLYHPSEGIVGDQTGLLLWQTGTPAVLEVQGGTNSRVSFSMISQTRSALLLAQEQAGDLALSLYNLPIAEQGMFKLIMLLPVGALVVVLLRILVGIRTSGTFMPVLIALAFLQTELIPGLVAFIIVVMMGLVIRSYLSSLNLPCSAMGRL